MNPRPAPPIVWPNTTQYKRALQRPELAFRDPELQQIQLETDAMGTPSSVEGQSAVVFFGTIAGRPVTIRCLKRPVAYGERRYASLGAVLAEWPDSPFASVDWLSNGVLVENRRWPIVRMDQIQGVSMRQYVNRALPGNAELEALSTRWRALAAELRAHRIAHSDLQQDNVRVLDDGALRLIDLDAVWAPPLAEMPPKEVGHRHFQHPERLRTGHWDAGVDAFSALVIYVSLRAIAVDPALWDEYHNDENLIFTDVDFENPGRTELWSRLAASRDLEVRDLVALLAQFCRQTVRIDVDLETILRQRTLPGGTVYVVSGEPLTRAWWTAAAETTGPEPDSGDPAASSAGRTAAGAGWSGPAAGEFRAGPVQWTPTGAHLVPAQPKVVDRWPYAGAGSTPTPGPASTPASGPRPVTKPAARPVARPGATLSRPGPAAKRPAGRPKSGTARTIGKRILIGVGVAFAVLIVIAVISAVAGQ